LLYDALNRLTSAQNGGTDCTKTTVNGKTEYWGNSYSYDAWGNLLGKSVTKCSAENLSATAAANNQLQGGYTYDAAGNMTWDQTDLVTAVYDAENRIGTATKNGATTSYTYDARGDRVEKSNGGSPPTGTLYWYMTPGIVGESDLVGNLKTEYVFFDRERVARKDFPSNAVSYYFSDHLKTASVVTDATGTILDESDYYPWGGELQFVNNFDNHYKFTGKERDTETGLDYFGARYYSNGLGQFISADWSAIPVPIPYADLHDPQTLTLYSYVRGLPTTRIDIDGHGFWRKLGSLLSEDGCWCEAEEYQKRHAAAEKKRQEEFEKEMEYRRKFIKENGYDPWAIAGAMMMAYPDMYFASVNATQSGSPSPVPEEVTVPGTGSSAGKAPSGGLLITETMSNTQFRKLVQSIAQSGLKNNVIQFVRIGEKNFVVNGNNRLLAARQLGITDQLSFQRVQLPFQGFKSEADVINAHADVMAATQH
jgi:RHS repeat-associated protein